MYQIGIVKLNEMVSFIVYNYVAVNVHFPTTKSPLRCQAGLLLTRLEARTVGAGAGAGGAGVGAGSARGVTGTGAGGAGKLSSSG